MYMALKKKDFILYRENSKIKSGGYSVNSILLQKNKAALSSIKKGGNKDQSGGGNDKMNNLFNNMAIPAGLLYMSPAPNPFTYKINDTGPGILSDTIHDELLKLVDNEDKQNFNIKTRKKWGGKKIRDSERKRKTRRNL
jgi:hypothetical protein